MDRDSPPLSDNGSLQDSQPSAPARRFSSKKRVQFKADADLVQVRPITPQSPRPLHRSRSAPSFAEMAPCDPRQVEQAMERARVSDFILSLGCRPSGGTLTPSSDPYYRIRPSGSATAASSAAHASNGHPTGAMNGTGVPPGISGRFLNWTNQAGVNPVSDTRPLTGHRATSSNTSSFPRFYTTSNAAAGYPRSSSSTSPSVTRPASANYPRLGFYRKLPVPTSPNLTATGGNSKRIDVGNTAPFITVRRLTSSASTPSMSSAAASHVTSGGFRHGRVLTTPSARHQMATSPETETGGSEENGRHGVVSRLTEINLGATV